MPRQTLPPARARPVRSPACVGFAGQDVAGRLAAARVIGASGRQSSSQGGKKQQSRSRATRQQHLLKRCALRFCGALWRCAEPSSATARFLRRRALHVIALFASAPQPTSVFATASLFAANSLPRLSSRAGRITTEAPQSFARQVVYLGWGCGATAAGGLGAALGGRPRQRR